MPLPSPRVICATGTLALLTLGFAATWSMRKDSAGAEAHVMRTSLTPETPAASGRSVAVLGGRNPAVDEDVGHARTAQEVPRASAYTPRNAPTPRGENRNLPEALKRWAAVDPSVATAWIAGMPDERRRRAATETVLLAWSVSDAQAVAVMLGQGTAGDFSDELAAHLTVAWAREDLPAAINWACQLAEGSMKDASMTVLLPLWAKIDPAAAAAQAARITPDIRSGDLLAVVLTAWAHDDPGAAAHWVAQQPPRVRRWR